jgi:hypothetical protein
VTGPDTVTDMAEDRSGTQAVVIGIGEYSGGPDWTLGAPVEDARRMVTWLRDSGVPAGRIDLLLAPLPAEPVAGVTARPADGDTVHRLFREDLPGRAGELLWVHWSGHGAVDRRRRRRLYCADATATARRAVDVDDLLAVYSSELVRSFRRQFWTIDACQTFAGPAGPPADEVAVEVRPRPDVEQDVLFAARRGEAAAELARARTGLFTRELLSELGPAGESAWPPEAEGLVRALRERFARMRASGHIRQTPAYFWFRGHAGDEGQVMHLPSARPAVPGRAGRVPMAESAAVVEALLAADEFVDPDGRKEILAMLRREITSLIPRHRAARQDAFAIVRTCLRFDGGLPELVDAVGFQTEGTAVREALAEAAGRLLAVRDTESH